MADPMPGIDPGPLAVTWLGHATALLEVDGYRLLTDPVWADRCSPSRSVGPQRLHPPPVSLEALPALDAVVISHDHYDHLDMDTVRMLARTQRAVFITRWGGRAPAALGSPGEPGRRMDWDQSFHIDDLTLTCTPARHFSGRFLSRNNTLWSSWAVTGPAHRAFFGGDSGYTASFADIGAQHGPFDLTLLPIGAYNKAWPDIHMNPEEAVRAHRDLNANNDGAGLLVPIHWGTFRLALHPWSEPAERLVAAAADGGVEVAVPKPGGRVAVDAAAPANAGRSTAGGDGDAAAAPVTARPVAVPRVLGRCGAVLAVVAALTACGRRPPNPPRCSPRAPQLVPAMPLPPDAVDNAVSRLDGLAEKLMDSSESPVWRSRSCTAGRPSTPRVSVCDTRTGESVDADTVFQLASLSKPLAATVTAHQVGVGAIGWDTRIVDELPWFALSDPAVTGMLTIGDLFAHRSGLPDHAGDLLEDLGYDRRAVLEGCGSCRWTNSGRPTPTPTSG